MAETESAPPTDAGETVELRDPAIAAFLGWLIPGAGHLYQGRYGKGVLFMVCILATFFQGLYLGGGKVVYASWSPEVRLPYICQVGAGLVALPALVQNYRVTRGREPLFGGFMRPPRDGELSQWQHDEHRYFELGTVYTMIAGLLNILAVFDAWGGPLQILPKPKKKKSADGATAAVPSPASPS